MKNDTLSTLTGEIEKDNNFIKARRILVTLSIILIGLVTLGITVQEVNTFIFKLSIDSPQYLGLIIAISLALSTIRYYSYAFSYQNKLKEIWCMRVVNDSRVLIPEGLYHSPLPLTSLGALDSLLANDIYLDSNSIRYQAKFPLRRHISYYLNVNSFQTSDEWSDEDNYKQRKFSIYRSHDKLNLLQAFKVLKIEFKYRFEIVFRSRVYFDIYYPYYLAIISIVLYIFHP